MSVSAKIKKKPYYKWIVFFVVSVGTFMATLDSSIVNVALPTISKAFGVGKGPLQWAVTGYLLTISSLLLAFGRLADIIGKNKVYAAGFLGFILGSALCGSANNVWQLVGFRIFQAVGAAMMMANGMGLVTSVFPPFERGRALGTVGTVVALGSLTGPSLGGVLVSSLGWKSIFYINVPIGVIGFIAAVIFLPRDKDIVKRQSFDYIGALLFGGAITLFLTSLSEGQELGWGSPRVLAQIILSVFFFILFFVTEVKVKQPMIDLSLFRNRLFLAGNAAGFLSFVAMSFVFFLVPFYLSEVLGLKPMQMGLVMTASPLVMAVVAPFSGWLSDRVGPMFLTTGGLALNALGLYFLSTVSTSTTPFAVAWRIGLIGFGSGMFQSPNNSSVMGTVPPPKLGISGGVLATIRNVGMVVGTALSVTIFNTRYAALKQVLPWQQAYVKSLSAVFITASVIALMGMAVSLVRGADKKAGRGPDREPGPGENNMGKRDTA